MPLIVDDTVGFGYWSLLETSAAAASSDTSPKPPLPPAPDILVSSLSKVFSGAGNCMGGGLILNALSPHYEALKPLLEAQRGQAGLSEADAIMLLHNARDLP